MVSRLRALNPLRHETLTLLEAGLLGLFFIQALRFVIGMLYSRTASASLVSAYPRGSLSADLPGLVDPAIVSQEIALLGLVLALPLLTLLLGRVRLLFVPAVLLLAGGRLLLVVDGGSLTPTMGALLAVAGGLLYVGLLIRQRLTLLPYFFLLGLGIDGLFRAYGNTLDPSVTPAYAGVQTALSAVAVLLSLLTALPAPPRDPGQRGTLSLWSALGLGGMLFLQLSLLALPNAISGRADADYTTFVPAVTAATLLPLIPFVRRQARAIIAPFDATTRGWVWLVVTLLLVVIGLRVQRINLGSAEVAVGGAALVLAQFLMSMVWWWFATPQGERKRSWSGLWLVFTPLIFGLLVTADLFTYEYAFVRNFAPPFDVLNPVVPPLLRGFRDLGLLVALLAAFLALLPMIQAGQQIPWRGSRGRVSLLALLLVSAATAAAAVLSRPPLIQPVLNVPVLRVGTYNIHGGYSEFFQFDLEALASTIERSGVEVVLLQEAEAGRLTSFGVDQTLWLARRLQMDRRFFPTTEGLHGLAVLSRVPIVFDDGVLIPGVDRQTGLQRVQIRPDESAVTLYNTSLGFLLQGSSITEQERNQRDQLNLILATLETHIRLDYGGQPGRMILGGTFHNVPDSPLMQMLARTGFIDPFAGTNPDLSATLVRVDRQARVDYLWLWSQSLSSTGNGVIASAASDHRLAFAGVQIRRGQP